MTNGNSQEQGALACAVLPGFDPLESLWQGDSPAFPSEHSARWAVKQKRPVLLKANALALFRGRIFIHRERFMAALQTAAMADYKARFAPARRRSTPLQVETTR